MLAESAALVLVLQPVAPDMLQRVQGQLADKLVTVSAVRAPGRTAIERAFRAARAQGAALVVWFDPEPRVTVNVLDVRRSRLIERPVAAAASGEIMARSARDEAAAFMVRSALEDIDEGRNVGRAVAPPPLAPAPCPPALAPLLPAPRWFVLGGGYLIGDGLSTLRGVGLGVLTRQSHFGWGVATRIAYATAFERDGFDLDVARYDLRLFGTYPAISNERVELGLGLSLGPALHRRTTRTVPAGYAVAPPSTQPDVFLGALAAASFRLTRSGVALRVALGLEAGLGDRALLAQRRREALDSAWPLQPGLDLALVFPLF